MSVPEFENPANPESKISLKQASVSDALQFAELNPDADESTLSNFLRAIQKPENFTDPLTWTAQTRQFALYWYTLHTTKNTQRKATYSCRSCGKKHTHHYDLKDLLHHVQAIQGKAERDFTFNNDLLRISPLNGSDMENFELKRFELFPGPDLTDDQERHNRNIRAQIRLLRVIYSIDLPSDLESDKNARYKNKESYVMSLDYEDYSLLENAVKNAQAEMNHGLKSEVDESGELGLFIGNAKCSKQKEGEVLPLLAVFRDEFSIPMV